jgi:hypothetical protein
MTLTKKYNMTKPKGKNKKQYEIYEYDDYCRFVLDEGKLGHTRSMRDVWSVKKKEKKVVITFD